MMLPIEIKRDISIFKQQFHFILLLLLLVQRSERAASSLGDILSQTSVATDIVL